MPESEFQVVVLLSQAVLLAGVLLASEHFKKATGMVLVYLVVGALQFPQTLLATTLYLELIPGLKVSPGSSVLFTATLFAVLMVHRLEGPTVARRLIYGVVFLNLTLAALMWLIHFQVESPLAVAAQLPAAAFDASARIIVLGSLVLLVDVILVVSVYELLGRLRVWPVIRIFATLLCVLTLDAVAFHGLSFWQSPNLASLIVSAVAAKAMVAAIYAIALAGYLRFRPVDRPDMGFAPILRYLTFRTDVDELVRLLEFDALTGARSRRYLDEALEIAVDSALRDGRALSLLMVDADHFKRVNDQHGHAAGDQVLIAIAEAIRKAVRADDAVCRYGGEEFTVIMPGSEPEIASQVAERIRHEVKRCHRKDADLATIGPFSVSIGVASCPAETRQADQLLELADARLYAAKQAGRDCVVAFGDEAVPSVRASQGDRTHPASR